MLYVYNAHSDALRLEIQTQKLPSHIQGRLRRMMAIISPTLTVMPQRDASALAAYENDLAALCHKTCLHKVVHDEDWANGAGFVHLDLIVEVRLVKGLSCEITGGNDHNI